jgi:outer membrane protein
MTKRSTTTRGRLVIFLLAACLTAGSARSADLAVGVVDMQRALNECKAGKKAKEQVRSKFESAQRELRQQREELDRARADYDKKLLVLKEEERRNLEKSLENRTLDFKRRYEDFQRDLKRTDTELTAEIVEELYELVKKYAAERRLTMVFEASSGAMVYSDGSLDITDEIIRRHDR